MRPIDADELLGIEKILSLGVRSTEARVMMEQVIFDIQQSPTINPEDLRPKGKWIEFVGQDKWICSECQYKIYLPFGETPEEVGTNYCPNCGSYNGGNKND